MLEIGEQYKRYIKNNFTFPIELDTFIYNTKNEEWIRWIKYVYNSLYFLVFQKNYMRKYNELNKELEEYKQFNDKFNNIKPNKIPKEELKEMQRKLTQLRETKKIYQTRLDTFEENIDIDIPMITIDDLNEIKDAFDKKLPKMNDKFQSKCDNKLNNCSTINEMITNFCIVYGNLLYSDNHYKEWCKKNKGETNERYDAIQLLF